MCLDLLLTVPFFSSRFQSNLMIFSSQFGSSGNLCRCPGISGAILLILGLGLTLPFSTVNTFFLQLSSHQSLNNKTCCKAVVFLRVSIWGSRWGDKETVCGGGVWPLLLHTHYKYFQPLNITWKWNAFQNCILSIYYPLKYCTL